MTSISWLTNLFQRPITTKGRWKLTVNPESNKDESRKTIATCPDISHPCSALACLSPVWRCSAAICAHPLRGVRLLAPIRQASSFLPMSEKIIPSRPSHSSCRCASCRGAAIAQGFYPRLLDNDPAAWTFFNKTNQKKGMQQQALADAVAIVAYAPNIDNLGVLGGAVGKICNRHCALGVAPELYQIVHDTLMASIGEVLTKEGTTVTDEIGGAWSNAVTVMALVEICITTEEGLNQAAEARAGGWRGFKDFELVKRTQVGTCTDTVNSDFAACDGAVAGFDFTPG